MQQAGLEDIYDTRDVTEVVFRTLRDMMTTEASDRIAAELQGTTVEAADKALQQEIADLWQDTNPLVRFLSRLRPPLEIKPETFMHRINQEAGLSRGIDPEQTVEAVFAALKDELSQERAQEIMSFLPGSIRQIWRRA